jgi:arginine-tRNA-protein transferase
MAPPVLDSLQLFGATAEGACPYLPGQRERKIITRLWKGRPVSHYGLLSRAGFRRSHMIAYRPACSHCRACVPVRTRVGDFSPSASLRRVARRNGDLSVQLFTARAGREDYALFARYVASRHGDGGMADMSYRDYRDMIEESPAETFVLQARHGNASGPLIAACLADRLDDGLSAVYSFFDPALAGRSLGTFLVLELVGRARALSLPYVYLGYWIAGSRKLAYKSRFRPVEGLGEDGWRALDEPVPACGRSPSFLCSQSRTGHHAEREARPASTRIDLQGDHT